MTELERKPFAFKLTKPSEMEGAGKLEFLGMKHLYDLDEVTTFVDVVCGTLTYRGDDVTYRNLANTIVITREMLESGYGCFWEIEEEYFIYVKPLKELKDFEEECVLACGDYDSNIFINEYAQIIRMRRAREMGFHYHEHEYPTDPPLMANAPNIITASMNEQIMRVGDSVESIDREAMMRAEYMRHLRDTQLRSLGVSNVEEGLSSEALERMRAMVGNSPIPSPF